MPSIASHFVVAKLVGNYLNINTDDFYKGNILPDIVSNKNSHLKIKGIYYDVPNIKSFYERLDLSNDLELGYLCHLLLDRYFLDEYVVKYVDNYKEEDPFLSKKMYNDYTKINYKLVKYFELDVNYINSIMNDIDLSIDKDKYDSNITSINRKEVNGELECLNLEHYIDFLKDVALKISDELGGKYEY